MDKERYDALMQNPILQLTEEEAKEWHFCWDWDGLLIAKDSPEFKCCVCAYGDVIRAASPS